MRNPLFTFLQTHFSRFQSTRNRAYQLAQEVLRESKRAIFALHREDAKTASASLVSAKRGVMHITRLARTFPRVRYDGAVHAAFEEYLEAHLYAVIVAGKPIDRVPGITATEDEYIGALSDVTGELVRRAVALGTRRDSSGVAELRDVMRSIIDHFLQLHLTGQLRQKFDDAKRNLNRVEDIYYQLSLR